MPRESPVRGPQEYRGWTITPTEGVQLGYRVGEGVKSRPGKGRKSKGYILTYPPDAGREKWCDTLKQAHAYIDEYMGPA